MASEIKGSRIPRTTGKLRDIVVHIVSTDGVVGVPVVGDAYPQDVAGLMARKCVQVETQPDFLPGIHLSIVTYRQFVAYE